MTQLAPDASTRPAAQLGGPGGVLGDEQVRAFVHEQLDAADLDGRSVCVLVPDGTRSCPMPLLLGAVHEALHGRVSRLTVLVAFGTHAGMGEVGTRQAPRLRAGRFRGRYPGMTVLTTRGGTRTRSPTSARSRAERIAELSGGLLRPRRSRCG